ncbi:flp pilus assembly protein CpaB [Mechercharimyces sp. CAU 1602]|uniref:flp pilus assembly protein CpaB n=1 Tax=Mechercharimyces sp. CAU 1602 TaxID=2973933 RepID=UPI002163B6CE|nr:flp pilus assembly protein CpaB [Mechercharimyces sp. CAU 1602]MCS1352428.1 flp pilus assembly protein CpaB [Mechercharimyces sp. CAU 1602]
MQDAKRRAIIFLVVALLLAALAGYLFLQKVSAVDARIGNMVEVYIANKEIPSRQPLKKEYFDTVSIPEQYLQEGAITAGEIDAIALGNNSVPLEYLVSVVPLSEGQPLTKNILKMQSLLTTDDKRMVTLGQSDRVQFDGQFEANDRIDLIVSDKGGNDTVTKVFMKNVPIVGVSKDENGVVNAIGLEMTLKEAELFIHKQNFAINIRVLKAPNEENKSKGKQGAAEEKKPTVEQKVDPPAQSDPTKQNGTDEGMVTGEQEENEHE